MFHVLAIPARHWGWVTIEGRDARDFLHRLTTVHVSALEVGHGAAGCFLSAQGKIRAFFHLWRFEADSYAFELDGGQGGHWIRELLATIDQYTFAEKLTVTDATAGLETRWLFAEAGQEAALLESIGAAGLLPGQTRAIDEEIRICHHGARDFGRPWISVWGRPQRLSQWAERALPAAAPATSALLERWRIQALRPRADAEITEATIPLEAGLTDALAQGKGCYPGQEVIERITSLGAPARRLVRIEGQGLAPSPGETILNLADPPAEVGEITSVSPTENATGFLALGFVRKIHAKEDLEVRFANIAGQGRITRVAPYA